MNRRIRKLKTNRGYLRYTFLCVFLFAGIVGYGQDCDRKLDQAKASYQAGNLYEIPILLEGCDRKFINDRNTEAFELLSLAYLYIDEPGKADTSYLNLLKADPEWAPDTVSEIEIDHLSKNFKTTPIFTIYPIKAGGNYSFIKIINVNGVDNPSSTRQSYHSRFGGQVGTGGDWNISDELSLAGEVLFTFKQYRYNNFLFPNPLTATQPETPGDSLVIDYTNIGFEVPVYVRYTHKINKWYPFA